MKAGWTQADFHRRRAWGFRTCSQKRATVRGWQSRIQCGGTPAGVVRQCKVVVSCRKVLGNQH